MSESEIITIIIAFNSLIKVISQLCSVTHGFWKLCLGSCATKLFFIPIKGEPTGIAFIDSKSIKVCHNLRIPRHKVFKGTAARSKGTLGWFYGFKLHILTNRLGDIVAAKLIFANIDDRKPVREISKGLIDRLYVDKGYISKALAEGLKVDLVTLITALLNNMKPKALVAWKRAMLSKRFIIKTIIDQLKNISQIEYACHWSLCG